MAYQERLDFPFLSVITSDGEELRRRLSGGIINSTSLVLKPGRLVPVVEVVHPSAYFKYKQELFARRIVTAGQTEIPFQKILSINDEGTVLEKEFFVGKTLHEVLSEPLDFSMDEQDEASLIYDLGLVLGRIHKCKVLEFGEIGPGKIIQPDSKKSWEDFFLHLWERRISSLEKVSHDKKVGSVKAKDVLQIVDSLNEFTRDEIINGKVLSCVREAYLTHFDFHFLNVLAHKFGRGWYISGILDLENMTAGDPFFDFVSIESQLWLADSSYGRRVKRLLNYLVEGYNLSNKNSFSTNEDFLRRRAVYHGEWALSYMEAVFYRMDFKDHPVSLQVEEYTGQHLQTLESLAKYKDLRGVDIPSIF